MELGLNCYSVPSRNASNDEAHYEDFISSKLYTMQFMESAAEFMSELEDLGIYHADIYLRNTIFA
jgi:hypothetical protein